MNGQLSLRMCKRNVWTTTWVHSCWRWSAYFYIDTFATQAIVSTCNRNLFIHLFIYLFIRYNSLFTKICNTQVFKGFESTFLRSLPSNDSGFTSSSSNNILCTGSSLCWLGYGTRHSIFWLLVQRFVLLAWLVRANYWFLLHQYCTYL